MHPHLIDVFARLDDSRLALRHAMAAVPPAARHERPGPDRWSPMEIVEHLALVDTRFSAIVGGKIADAVTHGLGPETAAREPLPPRVAEMLANRINRRTAPESALPSGRLDETSVWKLADTARIGFRSAVTSADGRALSTVIHEHPFFGPLNVYQWVELIAAHEMRHVAQVRETAMQLVARA